MRCILLGLHIMSIMSNRQLSVCETKKYCKNDWNGMGASTCCEKFNAILLEEDVLKTSRQLLLLDAPLPVCMISRVAETTASALRQCVQTVTSVLHSTVLYSAAVPGDLLIGPSE